MNPLSVSERIPIRLDPIAGESFDGWLDAYAQRLRVPTVDLAEALGVPRGLRRYSKLAVGHDTLDAERIARRACGIDPAHVRSLWVGLARYERLVTARVRGFVLARAARPLAWSRFCPICLADSGGRWLASWRLPWYLACPTHNTLLDSGCPRCDGPQRDRHIRADRVDALTTLCCRPTGENTGRGDNRCRHDLTTRTPTERAAPELIARQAQLIELLDPALSDHAASDLVDLLVDLLVVATHVGLDLRALTGDRHNATRLLAEPLTEAHRVLADPAGQRLRKLADTPGRPIPRSWNQASPSLDTALLGHRDGRLSATYRLRYRSMTASGRRPEGVDPAARLRAMPLALWPDWAIRLRPAAIDATHFRIAAAAALCLPGSTCSLRDITRRWQHEQVVDLPRLGRIITDDRRGTAILRALCALAETLDRDGAPIDYDRRRAIARDIELLDPDTWATVCGAGGMLRGAEFKLVAARLWLWETITGELVEQAPPLLGSYSPPEGVYQTLVRNANTYTITDVDGQQLFFDAGGFLTSETVGIGGRITYTYDGTGHLISQSDSRGRTTRFGYDRNGFLATMTESSGLVHRYTHDSAGNLTLYTSPIGELTKLIYAGPDLVRIDDSAGRSTSMTYDAQGRVSTIIDGLTSNLSAPRTTYAYAGPETPCLASRDVGKTTITRPGGSTISYCYDRLLRVTAQDPPAAQTSPPAFDDTIDTSPIDPTAGDDYICQPDASAGDTYCGEDPPADPDGVAGAGAFSALTATADVAFGIADNNPIASYNIFNNTPFQSLKTRRVRRTIAWNIATARGESASKEADYQDFVAWVNRALKDSYKPVLSIDRCRGTWRRGATMLSCEDPLCQARVRRSAGRFYCV